MKKYVSYSTLLSILFFMGCDDIIEDDITNDLIAVIAPVHGAQIKGNTVQFRWNEIAGADEYRIQVNDEVANSIILDSLVSTPIFNHTLSAGSYQWRVRGENFAYATGYSFDASFTMITSPDLQGQTVILESPENNIYTNLDEDLVFSWMPIETATLYEFEIIKVGGNSIFEDVAIVNTSITIANTTITEDGEYTWRVRAKNEGSSTNDFSRTFFVDTENPVVPSLITPTIDQVFTINEEISFTWNFDSDTGTTITGTLQIASDESFSNFIITEDANTTASFTYTFDTVDTYYWRVRGKDAAGNEGDYNETGQFTVN